MIGHRLAHAALWLYPPSIRRDHGDEIAVAIEGRWRECQTLTSRLRLSSELARDCVASWMRRDRRSPGTITLSATRPRAGVLSGLPADLRSAGRVFWREPVFAAGAVLTLGLGVGAATAVFSLADATLLRPLPISDPDRVVQGMWAWSYPDFADFASDQHVFSSTAAWTVTRLGFDHNGTTTQIIGSGVAGDFFGVADVAPLAGRVLSPADNTPGAPLVAAMSERLWRRDFASAPSLVGSTISIGRQAVTVVGILPAAFRGLSLRDAPDVYVPAQSLRVIASGFLARPGLFANRGTVWLQIAGRLRPGFTTAAADRDVRAAYKRLHPPDDGTNPDDGPAVSPLVSQALGLRTTTDLRSLIAMLSGATAMALLLACATVANLMLVRAGRRRRELALRIALGAGRWRVSRLLLVESLAIGLAGGGAGVGVAVVVMQLLQSFALPGQIKIADLNLSLDWRLLGASIALGAGTSLLFGLAPISQTRRLTITAGLGNGARGSARQPMRRVLVALQVALCVLLLGGSLSFGRALRFALGKDLGFDTSHSALLTVEPTLVRYPRARTLAFQRDALTALRSLPWVDSAAWALMRPLQGSMMYTMGVPGYASDTHQPISVQGNVVSTGFFEAMGVPLMAGRGFSASDTASSPQVAVIGASTAKKYWPEGQALGRTITLSDDPHDVTTIVGVVGDVARNVDSARVPMLYLPTEQSASMMDFGGLNLIVRSTNFDAAVVAREATAVLRQIDATVPITRTETIRDEVSAALMAQRLGLTLFGLFSALAVVLSALGIYAVVASAVAERTREFGIRVALGAAPHAILRLTLREGVLPVGLGLVAGLTTFALASRWLERFLFSLPATSVLTCASLAGAIACITVAAMVVPTRRAIAIAPAIALRSE